MKCKYCGIKIDDDHEFCSSECFEDCQWLKKRLAGRKWEDNKR